MYRIAMGRAAAGRQGLFIGEVAARSGVSRKALRRYTHHITTP